MPSYFNPWAWGLAWAGRDREVIPVQARFRGSDPFSAELVRPLVSWTNTRPEQTLSWSVRDAGHTAESERESVQIGF